MSELEEINNLIQAEIDGLIKQLDGKQPDSAIDHIKEIAKILRNKKLNKISSSKAIVQVDDQFFSESALIHLFKIAKAKDNLLDKMHRLKTAYMALGVFNNKQNGETVWQSKKMINAVNAKIAKDPKTKALKAIEEKYIERQSEFKRYGYSAQFKREMAENYPVITDIKTIERLITKLNKENKLIPR